MNGFVAEHHTYKSTILKVVDFVLAQVFDSNYYFNRYFSREQTSLLQLNVLVDANVS